MIIPSLCPIAKLKVAITATVANFSHDERPQLSPHRSDHTFLMLAALNIRAVVAGFAAGGLSATVIAFLVGGSLALLDVENGADIGLFVGVLVGLGVSGWVSGRMAVHSHRFHGSVTALLLGGLLVLLASLGSTSSSVLDVLILALVSMIIGGLGGVLGGRRGRPQH
jgi:hypothetical protein